MMKTLSSEYAQYAENWFPKGTFDKLILFISEYLHRSAEFGLLLDNKDGAAQITLPDSVSAPLVSAYFHAVKNGYGGIVACFMVEQAFYRVTHGEHELSGRDIAECALLRQLLSSMSSNDYKEVLDEVEQLSGYLCTPENRRDVTVLLEKAKKTEKNS